MNSAPNNRDGFTLRMDFVESAKSQWTGRYSWGDENQSSTGLSVTGTKILTNYEQYLGTNTRTLSPDMVNEARFGYSRFTIPSGTYSAGVIDTVVGPRNSRICNRARRSPGASRSSRSAATVSPPSATTRTGLTSSTTTPRNWSTIFPGRAASTPSASASNTTARTSTRSAISSRAANSSSSPTPLRARPRRAAMPSPNSCWAISTNPL